MTENEYQVLTSRTINSNINNDTATMDDYIKELEEETRIKVVCD